MSQSPLKKIYSQLPLCIWLVSFVATLGSLSFSELFHFPPCTLCWYQRIMMYPLVFIIGVGIFRKDKNYPFYVLPLSIIGMIIALYHNLLYYSIIPHSLAPCSAGVSCTTKYIEWFGFITIPLLSLIGFILITSGVILLLKKKN